MTDTQKLEEIAAQFAPEQNVTIGKWFGKPCLKTENKVFVTLWEGDLAFKLMGNPHSEALQIEGAHLFDPRGKGHPMKKWVQIPVAQSSVWSQFAGSAYECVTKAAELQKNEIISKLIETRQEILNTASALSSKEQNEVFLGIWSAKDLLAHLVGWDFTNLEAAKQILAGELPDFYNYHDRDWKTYNARLVAEHRKEDFAELLSSVKDSLQKLSSLLETIPAEEFDKDRGIRAGGYKVTIARLLQAEINDERTHYSQIKEFMETTHSPV